MLKNIRRLLRDEEAPTAVEWALIVAGVAVLIIAAYWFLGGWGSSDFGSAGNAVSK